MAKELRLRPAYIVGHLHLLWHNALEQAEDGDLSSWSDDFIASSAGYPGDAPQFVRLLQKHGWLDGKMIHDWLNYTGRYLDAKYRTSNPARLKEIVEKHEQFKKSFIKSDFSPTLVRPPNLTLPNLTKQEHEHFDFASLWERYPKKLGKSSAQRHFNASVKTEEDYESLNKAINNFLASRIALGDPQYIPHGSTWFNNWRDWIDYQEPKTQKTAEDDLIAEKKRLGMI